MNLSCVDCDKCFILEDGSVDLADENYGKVDIGIAGNLVDQTLNAYGVQQMKVDVLEKLDSDIRLSVSGL